MNVLVVGSGSAGLQHMKVLGLMPEVFPVALPVRPERIEKLQAAGFTTVRNFSEAQRKDITHCIVATDSGRHVQDAIKALDMGCDVLIEKPLATNALRAKSLCERARNVRKQVFVGCLLRFSESLNCFRQLLAEIGSLHSVRIECKDYLPDWRPNRQIKESYSARSGEGGVLLDLIHEIDYAGWVFGWPVEVQARLVNRGRLGIEADELATVMWETTDESIVTMELDYLTRPARRRARASGENGTIEWNGIDGTVSIALAGQTVRVERFDDSQESMMLAQDSAFLQRGSGVPTHRLATGEDGVKALAVCDATSRSSANRRPEQVEY